MDIPSRTKLARLSGWIFFIAWWIGSGALIGGLKAAEGFAGNLGAGCVFAVACTMWWVAYKLSNFSSRFGFVVIALWLFGLLSALLDFRYYVTKPFFWASGGMLLALIVGAAIPQGRSLDAREP